MKAATRDSKGIADFRLKIADFVLRESRLDSPTHDGAKTA